jgi:alginate O-acetyltransferase complex protein AlgJ
MNDNIDQVKLRLEQNPGPKSAPVSEASVEVAIPSCSAEGMRGMVKNEGEPRDAWYAQAQLGHSFESKGVAGERKWVTSSATWPLILLFGVYLCTPLAGFLEGWSTGIVLGENRAPAPEPNFAREQLSSYPKKFDAYFADHYGFRIALVRAYNIVLRKVLSVSSDEVVIGKDHWLYYAGQDVFADHLGQVPFRTDELGRWKARLEHRHAWLAARGIKYVFMVAPNKNSIYPEKLPDYLASKGQLTRMDQLVAYLKISGSPVEILDLRSALIAAKVQGTLYYPQDTHWNGIGRYVAYLEMCNRLRKWFPDLRPLVLGNELKIQTVSMSAGEWTMFGLPEQNRSYQSEMLAFQRPAHAVLAKVEPLAGLHPLPVDQPFALESPGTSGRLLVFHDSFMRAATVDPYMEEIAEHFSRSTFIAGRPEGNWLAVLVDREHPTVVIEERVERYLGFIPGVDDFSASHAGGGQGPSN